MERVIHGNDLMPCMTVPGVRVFLLRLFKAPSIASGATVRKKTRSIRLAFKTRFAALVIGSL